MSHEHPNPDPANPTTPARLNPTTQDYVAHGHLGAHGSSEAADPHAEMSMATYVAVFAALMVLLVLTVAVAFVHLGPLNLAAALAIAIVKALLVLIFFMHLKVSSRLTKIFVVATFLWLGILFVYTFSDYLSRPWLPMSRGWNPYQQGMVDQERP
jgi:cytochrome c oxidase subunit 4